MNEKKRKLGWKAFGVIGLVFTPIGLIYAILTFCLWHFHAGETPRENRILVAVFGCLGTAFLVLGLVFLWKEHRRRAGLRRALDGGYAIQADVAGVQAVRTVTVNGRHPYVVECHWTDGSGAMHVAFSRYLNFDPTEMLRDRQVPVYIDRMDEKSVFVDIDAVLPEVEMHN